MKIENRDGWYALFISITQNISPAQALAGMEGKRKGLRSLSWEEFVRVYREGEEKLREDSRKYRNTESNRAYQREYRRLHPATAEQKLRRNEYQRKYREAQRHRVCIAPEGKGE